MYVDKNLLMTNAQTAFTTAAAYIYGDYSIDLKTTGRYGDIGAGKPVAVVFTVDTAFAGTAGCLITFQIRCDVDLTIDASSVIVAQTAAIAVTALTAGRVIVLPIPAGILGSTYDHLGVSFLTSTQNGSAGAVSSFVAFDW